MEFFVAKAGPFALDARIPPAFCKITKPDHDWLRYVTGCSVWCRSRKQWPEKMMTLSGPPSMIERAKHLADELLLYRAGLAPRPYYGSIVTLQFVSLSWRLAPGWEVHP